jgi:hypothetical protein
MNKTLQKNLTKSTSKKPAVFVESEKNSEELIDLMKEMKHMWQQAAEDLMQPRPEAVAQLLKKVLH